MVIYDQLLFVQSNQIRACIWIVLKINLNIEDGQLGNGTPGGAELKWQCISDQNDDSRNSTI